MSTLWTESNSDLKNKKFHWILKKKFDFTFEMTNDDGKCAGRKF